MYPTIKQERSQLIQYHQYLTNGHTELLDEYAMSLFRYQYKYNPIYRQFCTSIGKSDKNVLQKNEIPHLPISAFKYREIKSGQFDHEEIFTSSGTTHSLRSSHYVRDVSFYRQHATHLWQKHFDHPGKYCFLALLPGYMDREGSSLISMVDHFIQLSDYSVSGFYLRDHGALADAIQLCRGKNIPVVLFGVTHALLDFGDVYSHAHPQLIIVETGGMKGRKQELTKKELHQTFRALWATDKVYSEYGMTEMLSQVYSESNGCFKQHEFLQVQTKQINDPLSNERLGKPGILCVTDLANIDSCAFIQTEDLGILHDDQTFEIVGRQDASDLRGCNLLLHEAGIH
ncbi:MAG: acyl transferase [Saprospiraceae bacterium]